MREFDLDIQNSPGIARLPTHCPPPPPRLVVLSAPPGSRRQQPPRFQGGQGPGEPWARERKLVLLLASAALCVVGLLWGALYVRLEARGNGRLASDGAGAHSNSSSLTPTWLARRVVQTTHSYAITVIRLIANGLSYDQPYQAAFTGLK